MNFGIPQEFLWRRLHSLTGLFFALFLIEHLLVNSQAALFLGDDGQGFINAVNSIHNFPYLPLVEIFLLGVPILIHMAWGIKYLQTSHPNSFRHNGAEPYLPEYPRNKAYTWQRITSWILLFGVIAHVIHMRFIEEPIAVKVGTHEYYLVRLQKDEGLQTLAARLGVTLLDKNAIEAEQAKYGQVDAQSHTVEGQLLEQHQKRATALQHRALADNQIIAESPDFGTAELLIVREIFKMPLMIALYTLFVLSASFHGFNGLWTFMIKWGVTLTVRSQELMLKVSTFLMVLVAFMGLAAIWGTYWLNLKQ